MRDLKRAFDTQRKISNEPRRWLVYLKARLLFTYNNIPWGRGWRFRGVPIIQKHRCSRMSFGPGLGLRSSVRSNPLAPNHPVILATWRKEACLEIGANLAMTGGAICAAERIIIGNNVAVGANTPPSLTQIFTPWTRNNDNWNPQEVGLLQL